MSIAEQINNHIVEFITYGDPIDNDESLIESGMIDSTGAMDMVLFIEETFGVQVPNKEIGPDTMDTVNLITALVEKLQNSKVAA